MNVSLTPELEAVVSSKVESGMYHSASEVVREGLRLLVEQDRLRQLRFEELKQEIAHGIAQADQGDIIEGEEVFARLHKLNKQLAQGFEQIEQGECREYHSAEEFANDIKAEGRKRLTAREKQDQA